ncbi:hypothetical protein K491DRAFT_656687 [Lophiostoma macrostomum CBS 122681]|uniref:Cell death in tomato 1 n=1 Tax=Lophiostoma macrostomum CBS 122681 TaxID=1314788 RepID=A0A6A6TBU8_9PLEO|nr:hypothetical protein K491DRAFT_656687 [Lophiostoma macrostomum CBS 122681]
MYTAALLTTLAATAVSAAVLPGRAALENWEVTALGTHSPSGRPGNDPHLFINATINDPNTIPAGEQPTGTAVFPPSTAQCNIEWLSGETPWGVEQPCTSSTTYSTWTVTLEKPSNASGTPSGTENFALQFKLVDYVHLVGQEVTKVYEGEGEFAVGGALTGQCGGSGVCNWGLKSPPYAIVQYETE